MINEKLKIIQVIDETPFSKTFRFDCTSKNFDFISGQFVMITVETPTGPISRAYSIASSAHEKEFFDITIKEVPDGKLSSRMNELLKEGDEILVKGPYGKFTFEGKENAVLIGAGSGVTPLMSMARTAIDEKLPINIDFLISNKKMNNIIYKEELDEISEHHENFNIFLTLTREDSDEWKGALGRIDKKVLETNVRFPSKSIFYLCGPPDFVNGVTELLKELNIAEDKIRMEKY